METKDLVERRKAAVARGGFGPRMRTAVGALMARAGMGAGAEPAPEAEAEAPVADGS